MILPLSPLCFEGRLPVLLMPAVAAFGWLLHSIVALGGIVGCNLPVKQKAIEWIGKSFVNSRVVFASVPSRIEWNLCETEGFGCCG